MLLSYEELCRMVDYGVVSPVLPEAINAASIDVRLGNTVVVEVGNEHGPNLVSLADRKPLASRRIDITGSYYDLQPGEFILAHTVEMFDLPNDIAAEFKLKSSGARIGLDNVLATWADPGWNGSVLTLELKNVTRLHTIRLHPGDYIGQMIFHRTQPVPPEKNYAARGRYNGDTSVQEIKA